MAVGSGLVLRGGARFTVMFGHMILEFHWISSRFVPGCGRDIAGMLVGKTDIVSLG